MIETPHVDPARPRSATRLVPALATAWRGVKQTRALGLARTPGSVLLPRRQALKSRRLEIKTSIATVLLFAGC
jgi:hypothetical protein